MVERRSPKPRVAGSNPACPAIRMTKGFGESMIEQLKQFFSEAKAEFKKISWPSTEDIKGSTTVVCVTIFFLMVLTGLV